MSEEKKDIEEICEDVKEEEINIESNSGENSEDKSDGIPKEEEVDYKDQLLRLQAEFVNYRRRADEERADFVKFAASKAIETILPGIDHLNLAMNHVPEGTDKNWIVGMEASLKSVIDGLESVGVKKMDLIGKEYNHDWAEVLTAEPGENNIVTKVVQDGYLIHDKVLRLAKVIVGNGEPIKS